MTAIHLATVGEVDDDVMAAVEAGLSRTFALAPHRLKPLPDPAYAFDTVRRQYSSIAIMRDLVRHRPPGVERVLAVTEKDLFIPMLSFIYGQAQLRGNVAMISLARLRQEFYSLPVNRSLLLARAVKEALHEVGHTFGLIHCLDGGCPMSLSTNIRQLDAKGTIFCSSCAIILQENMRMLYTESTDGSGTEMRP